MGKWCVVLQQASMDSVEFLGFENIGKVALPSSMVVSVLWLFKSMEREKAYSGGSRNFPEKFSNHELFQHSSERYSRPSRKLADLRPRMIYSRDLTSEIALGYQKTSRSGEKRKWYVFVNEGAWKLSRHDVEDDIARWILSQSTTSKLTWQKAKILQLCKKLEGQGIISNITGTESMIMYTPESRSEVTTPKFIMEWSMKIDLYLFYRNLILKIQARFPCKF